MKPGEVLAPVGRQAAPALAYSRLKAPKKVLLGEDSALPKLAWLRAVPGFFTPLSASTSPGIAGYRCQEWLHQT